MDVIAFMHELRQEIVGLTGRRDILLRFQVTEGTQVNTVVLEVVSIGETIIPFVWEAADFEDVPASRTFILNEISKSIPPTKASTEPVHG